MLTTIGSPLMLGGAVNYEWGVDSSKKAMQNKSNGQRRLSEQTKFDRLTHRATRRPSTNTNSATRIAPDNDSKPTSTFEPTPVG